uniref:ANK_REP_REGION domain-containing protein n=1 Tax=Bursaphelenchus xylophilus TaxID=6326 RepID=A0A1I7RHD0_BURXY
MGRAKNRKVVPTRVKQHQVAVRDHTVVIECLKPYVSLLPDLRSVGTSKQKALHLALYHVGCSAAQALESYLKEKPINVKGDENSSESEELRLLLNYVSVEMAADDLKRVCMGEDGKILLRDEHNKILNEVAAAALSAFTFAAAGRPATRHVEYLMNPTASVDGPDENGSHASTAVSADPKGGGYATGHYVESLFTNPFNPKSRKKDGSDDGEEYSDEEDDEDSDDDDIDDPNDETANVDRTDALLRFACSVGYTELVRQLVKIRGSAEYSSIRKTTMLMEACCVGHTEIVKELISFGADVNALSGTLNTALIYASTTGKVDCVRLLLQCPGVMLDIRNASGHTALMEASSAGHLDVVKELLAYNADIFAIVENVDFKESSLSLASYRGHVEVVKYLFQNMADTPEKLEELHTGLLEAAMNGHYEVAKALLDGGAPVNLPTENFESPLTLAACGGHLELVELLVERGADLEEPNDEGYTPLMEAAREGYKDVVEYLLDHGANVNSKIEEGIETPLTLAASGGYLSVVQILVRRGGDLFLGERTPLYEAVQEGHVEVTKFIINELKNTERKEDAIVELNCALVCAAENASLPMCNLLLENGAGKDSYSREGRTPLMEAARHGNIEIIDYLILKGVDVNKSSPNNDATALSLSCLYGHAEATKLLLMNGANPEHTLRDSVSCIIEASRNGSTECAKLLLDYISHPDRNHRISTAVEISNRPKIKPVSKLQNGVHATTRPQSERYHPNETGDASSRLDHLPGQRNLTEDHSHSNSVKSAEESTLAHFMYNTLIEPKRKDGWSDNDLEIFMDMISTAKLLDINPKAIAQAMTEFENTGGLIGLNSLAESSGCPSCQHSQRVAAKTSPNLNVNTAAVLNAIHNARSGAEEAARVANAVFPHGAPAPDSGLLNSTCNATIKRKVVKSQTGVGEGTTKATTTGLKQKLAETSELIRSKLESLSVEAEYLAQLSNSSGSTNAPAGSLEETMLKLRELGFSYNSANQMFPSPCFNNRNSPVPSDHPVFVHQQKQILHTHQSNVYNPVIPTEPAPANPRIGRRVSKTGASERRTASAGSSLPPTSEPLTNRTIEDPHVANFVDIQTETNSDTALTVACVGGHDALVKLLIERGANIEHRDKKGFTPLILAATGGHVEVCKLLIGAHCVIDAQSDRTKDTALSLACSGGRRDVVELLLQYGANKEHRNVSDYTPLSLAASGGYVDIITLLLNAGAEINSRTGSKLGISPLMLAAMNGHDQATLLLLERGSDINAQIETNRNTALTLACFQGRTEVVRLLLRYGANVEHRAKTGLTPLMEAANGGYTEVGELLLLAGADPNAPPVPSSRDTALTIAADKGHSSFVDILLDHNAAIDVRNKKGCTPLFLACSGGHLPTVKSLILKGADPDAMDNRKTLPLVAAFRKGHLEVVEYMVCHVTQFPNDSECLRFYKSCGDEEAASKIKKCFCSIVTAKEKQAEQANKAADDLLQLLEEEKKQAKVKEETKKKQKEKKKAKKLARKLQDLPSEKDMEEDQEAKENVHKIKAASPEVEKSPEEERVPVVPFNEKVDVKESFAPVGKQKRQSRRQRNESSAASISVTSPRPSPLPNNGVFKSSTASSNEESEWHSAGKKRAVSRHGKEPRNSKDSSTHEVNPSEFEIISDITHDNPNILETLNQSDLNSKRRVYAMIVNSNTVARIIGRAGQNINAIREATGAHIEVEKIATRREQSTRQIVVKGLYDVAKLAVTMIDQLIRDSETHVSDIIKRVTRSRSRSSTNTQSQGYGTTYRHCGYTVASSNASNVSSNQGLGNVWQKRAATIRHVHPSTDPASIESQSSGSPPPPIQTPAQGLPVSSSVSPIRSQSDSPIPHLQPTSFVNETIEEVLTPNRLPDIVDEDLRRKAPGCDRPSANQARDPQRNEPFNFIHEPELPSFSNTDLLENNFVDLAGILKDVPIQLSANVGTASSPIIPPLSSLNGTSPQSDKKPRPLSEIWDNRGSEPNSSDSFGLGFSSMFGSSLGDPKASLWLPPQPKTESVRDDTWLGSSGASMFGAIGSDKNGTPKGNRPHSSTDWTNSLPSNQMGWGQPNDSNWSGSPGLKPSLPAAIGCSTRSTESPRVQNANWSNGERIDVFHQLAAQLGDAAEKEKQKHQTVQNAFSAYNQVDDRFGMPQSRQSMPPNTQIPTTTAAHPTVIKSYLDSMQQPSKDYEMMLPNQGAFFNQLTSSSSGPRQFPSSSRPGLPTNNQNGPQQPGMFYQNQRNIQPPAAFVQPPPGFQMNRSGGQIGQPPPPPPFFNPQVAPRPSPVAGGFPRNGNMAATPQPQTNFPGANWSSYPGTMNPQNPKQPFNGSHPQWNNSWNF